MVEEGGFLVDVLGVKFKAGGIERVRKFGKIDIEKVIVDTELVAKIFKSLNLLEKRGLMPPLIPAGGIDEVGWATGGDNGKI
ncbi:unnamed protein product [marine sediment metagenome]|uniref:Uncharacterized protein n=1 Tax=marine sediment metagenome TaxID=412755 RepID=X1N8X3_9ZZZZ